MILKKILTLVDNYVWILYNIYGFCIIIDPGVSEPIIQEIDKNKWFPIAILLTHNHIDHVGGVKKLVKYYPKITVFGPNETKKVGVDKILVNGDRVFILNKIFYVFFTPGHTLGHLSYYSEPYLFCGDTLFSGGCGNVYNKKYLDMFYSIKLILSLPNTTILCCSHEYTLSNLKFSISILPDDKNIKLYFKKIKKKIRMSKTSLPSCLLIERKINLFLRTHELSLKNCLGLDYRYSSFNTFVELRLRKDVFGAKRD